MFCDVVIPRAKLDALTYQIPDHLEDRVKVGSAVKVELVKKPVPGVVVGVRPTSDVSKPKPLLDVIENEFCDSSLLDVTRWVSHYYMAYWGETLTMAFPGKVIGYKPRQPWQPPEVLEPAGSPPTLTLDQHQAARVILDALDQASFRPFLLFGVTGSGKTEIYLRAVEATLRRQKSAIALVPEIALTPLLISRFAERFPGRLVALHSGLREAERKKYWQALRDGKVNLVIGARSAVFAPVRNLGLIVVDEEHDHSYKEHDRMPHFNARDVAVVRAKFSQAVVILASATPSIESFYNAQRKVYQLLELPKRIADRPLPKATIVSMRGQRRRAKRMARAGQPIFEGFSPILVDALKSRIGSSEQAILFVSRRGFASQVVCTDCGHVPKCKYCGVPLVYHEDKRQIQCHFCKFAQPAFDLCPICQGENLDYYGLGTQRVVQELGRIVPGARVLRLDSDAVTRPETYRQILDAFTQGEAEYLVGTQMVTKGFDFPRVTLCAVVSADSTLNMPDFRSAERTFQLLTQVAGRAGRGDQPGNAFFQTLHPDHYAINFAAQQNYRRFYEAEIKFRQSLAYPPFTRLALVRIMSLKPETCTRIGEFLKQRLGGVEGIQVMGPIPAYRKKKRNMHIYLLLVRIRKNLRFQKLLDRSMLNFPRVRIDLDIDPQEIL